jgi:hypothetical protein
MVFGRSLASSGMLPAPLGDTLIGSAAQLSECRLLSSDFLEGLNLDNAGGSSQNSPLPLPPKPAIQRTGIQALFLTIYFSSFAYAQDQDF